MAAASPCTRKKARRGERYQLVAVSLVGKPQGVEQAVASAATGRRADDRLTAPFHVVRNE